MVVKSEMFILRAGNGVGEVKMDTKILVISWGNKQYYLTSSFVNNIYIKTTVKKAEVLQWEYIYFTNEFIDILHSFDPDVPLLFLR